MKSKQEQLKSFKKANQAYKLSLANRAGFKTTQDYLIYLTSGQMRGAKKPTIHICNILDASGSMDGGKYDNSCKGIKEELVMLRSDKAVNYTYSFVEFVQEGLTVTHNFLSEMPNSVGFYGAKGGNTPLYQAVFETLAKLKAAVKTTDKVLVKVFTDGENNRAKEYLSRTAKLIGELQEANFTITFVATERDMTRIQRDLNLDESNTLAVQDSAQGFEHAFMTANSATRSYSKSVLKDKDVSLGFYKQKGTL